MSCSDPRHQGLFILGKAAVLLFIANALGLVMAGTPLEGKPKKIVMNPTMSIALDSPDEDRLVGSPASIDEDADGNIYVLDFKSRNIKKYSKQGTFIKNIGRKGQGPGEIPQFTVDLVVNNKKIYLLLINMVLIYDLDGRPVETIRLTFFPRYIGTDNKGNILLLSNNENQEKMITVLDGNGTLMDSYEEQFEARDPSFRAIFRKWLPDARSISKGGEIIAVHPFKPEIIIYDGKDHKRSMSFKSRSYRSPKYVKDERGSGHVDGGVETIMKKDGYLFLVMGEGDKRKVIEAYDENSGEFICGRTIHADGFVVMNGNGSMYICDDERITGYTVKVA